ncbi:MAG: ATP-binding cassette domain-containing protein [Streptosporangiales bacterium]
MDEPLVLVEGVRKRFGEMEALRGLDMRVAEGSVFGLLGPNGAGKTTAIRVLATLLVPDAGRATIAGYDVVREADRVRHLIGLAGQHAALDEKLTGRENLVMFGRLYHIGERAAQRRADELLERFDLADAGNRLVKHYSGGMRRRLDLITSLIVAPPLLFLDEPTTGLDPHSRNEIWDTVRELVAGGTTVLLTTQYLDEADRLADHIAVVDRGQVIASGRPTELKSTIGHRVEVTFARADALPAAQDVLRGLVDTEVVAEPDALRVSFATDSTLRVPDVIRALDAVGVTAEDISVHRPTLDEVFLRVTGHAAESDAETEPAELAGSMR